MMLWILSLAGFLLSLYAYLVEVKYEKDRSYQASCDISSKMSCTKAFSGEYGRMLGISNALVGMLAYGVLFFLALLGYNIVVFYLSMGAVLASVFLAYILYFRIKTVCIICTSLYIVNILLLIFSALSL